MWNKISNRTKSYELDGEPERIHIIETGFKDCYIIAYEDGYEQFNNDKINVFTPNTGII